MGGRGGGGEAQDDRPRLSTGGRVGRAARTPGPLPGTAEALASPSSSRNGGGCRPSEPPGRLFPHGGHRRRRGPTGPGPPAGPDPSSTSPRRTRTGPNPVGTGVRSRHRPYALTPSSSAAASPRTRKQRQRRRRPGPSRTSRRTAGRPAHSAAGSQRRRFAAPPEPTARRRRPAEPMARAAAPRRGGKKWGAPPIALGGRARPFTVCVGVRRACAGCGAAWRSPSAVGSPAGISSR